MRRSWAWTLLLLSSLTSADDSPVEFGGHTKLRLTGQTYPADSVIRDLAGSSSLDLVGELRLNFSARRGPWSFHTDYQVFGISSELLSLQFPSDEARFFDFTKVVSRDGDNALLHRLDRFWVGYSSERLVVRAGRQALSWGNGLFFTPMDLVNPFAATAIDTEYKAGDDMLYVQYLRDSGDDVQVAIVSRRNPANGDIESEQGTIAAKYHGFLGDWEYDVLVAEDTDQTIVGLGAAGSIGGAVWRGDVVVTDEPDDTRVELVTNLSYSWVWAERNVTSSAEYYFNGDDRHYLAGNLLIELSPLWSVSPTLIGNVDDPSGQLQLITTYSLGDNVTFLGSLNVPLGANGTEFGGLEVPLTGRYLSFDVGVFAQLAWYF